MTFTSFREAMQAVDQKPQTNLHSRIKQISAKSYHFASPELKSQVLQLVTVKLTEEKQVNIRRWMD